MYSSHFEYFRPKTLSEAARLLKKHRGARVLAGGHSLLPAMKFRLASAKALIDIGAIKGLSGIKAKGKTLEIGATTTHAEIAASAAVQRPAPSSPRPPPRSATSRSATAAPSADRSPTPIRRRTSRRCSSPSARRSSSREHKGARKIPAEKFFLDLFTTALKPTEILTAILVPASGKGTGGAYLKHPHPASRYAVVGVAAIVDIKDGKVARTSLVIGGVTHTPVRASAAEAALTGQKPGDASIAAAAAKVAAALEDPLSDHYASGEFRVNLATVLAKRALATAAGRARS